MANTSNYLRRRRLCFYFGLFVCLSVRLITKKVVNGFWRNFLVGVGYGPGTEWLHFGDGPYHRPDPGVRNRDSLDYRLCWRSAEVCPLWALLVDKNLGKHKYAQVVSTRTRLHCSISMWKLDFQGKLTKSSGVCLIGYRKICFWNHKVKFILETSDTATEPTTTSSKMHARQLLYR